MFLNRKPTDTQRMYSVTELELHIILETLKEVKGILQGQQLKATTDPTNIMQNAFSVTSYCVYHWMLLLEEHGPEF